MNAIHALVTGRVQGVGYRYATENMARRLGLTGWVRNRPDGSVETWAQGSEAAIKGFVAFLHDGPRGARVTAVNVSTAEPDEHLSGFAVRF